MLIYVIVMAAKLLVSTRDLAPNPQSAVDNALQSNEIHKDKSHEYADNAEYLEFLVTANLLLMMQLNYPTMNPPLMI